MFSNLVGTADARGAGRRSGSKILNPKVELRPKFLKSPWRPHSNEKKNAPSGRTIFLVTLRIWRQSFVS